MSIIERLYMTFIYQDRWKFFYEGLMMTLILTLSSFILGSLLGALICSIRTKANKGLRKIIDIIIEFLVQIPTLVLLMIFMYVIFNGLGISSVIVCIVGLTIKNAAYLANIFESAINSVNPGEIEAARALGMNKSQAFIHVTLPQAVNAVISIYQNQFVSCLQETSIVGSLAVVELTKSSSIVTSRTLDAIFGLVVVSVIYIAIGAIGTFVIGLINKQKHLGETQ